MVFWLTRLQHSWPCCRQRPPGLELTRLWWRAACHASGHCAHLTHAVGSGNQVQRALEISNAVPEPQAAWLMLASLPLLTARVRQLRLANTVSL